MNAAVLFTAEVFCVLLRVLECQGKRWLCSEDIAKVCEYRSYQTVTGIARRNRHAIEGHTIKARIDGAGHAFCVFDEEALRYICKYSPRPGALHLLRWLDAGGLQAPCNDVIPFDSAPVKHDSAVVFESKPKCEIDYVFEPHPKDKNILAFRRPQGARTSAMSEKFKSATAGAFGSRPTGKPNHALTALHLEQERLYCTDLLALLLEHSEKVPTDDRRSFLVSDIRTVLDELIDGELRDNYEPKLNAARYELFSSYWLDGGDV